MDGNNPNLAIFHKKKASGENQSQSSKDKLICEISNHYIAAIPAATDSLRQTSRKVFNWHLEYLAEGIKQVLALIKDEKFTSSDEKLLTQCIQLLGIKLDKRETIFLSWVIKRWSTTMKRSNLIKLLSQVQKGINKKMHDKTLMEKKTKFGESIKNAKENYEKSFLKDDLGDFVPEKEINLFLKFICEFPTIYPILMEEKFLDASEDKSEKFEEDEKRLEARLTEFNQKEHQRFYDFFEKSITNWIQKADSQYASGFASERQCKIFIIDNIGNVEPPKGQRKMPQVHITMSYDIGNDSESQSQSEGEIKSESEEEEDLDQKEDFRKYTINLIQRFPHKRGESLLKTLCCHFDKMLGSVCIQPLNLYTQSIVSESKQESDYQGFTNPHVSWAVLTNESARIISRAFDSSSQPLKKCLETISDQIRKEDTETLDLTPIEFFIRTEQGGFYLPWKYEA